MADKIREGHFVSIVALVRDLKSFVDIPSRNDFPRALRISLREDKWDVVNPYLVSFLKLIQFRVFDQK